MRNRCSHLVPLVLAVLAAVLYLAAAQLMEAQTAGRKTITVTGCLQKGDDPDEFAITGENGKNYDLKSATVDLGKHVGHKVAVTGALEPEEKEEKDAKGGDVQVASLKMISTTCK